MIHNLPLIEFPPSLSPGTTYHNIVLLGGVCVSETSVRIVLCIPGGRTCTAAEAHQQMGDM